MYEMNKQNHEQGLKINAVGALPALFRCGFRSDPASKTPTRGDGAQPRPGALPGLGLPHFTVRTSGKGCARRSDHTPLLVRVRPPDQRQFRPLRAGWKCRLSPQPRPTEAESAFNQTPRCIFQFAKPFHRPGLFHYSAPSPNHPPVELS